MENKVYAVYNDDKKRIGIMIVSGDKTNMYINEENPQQATRDAIEKHRDILTSTEKYQAIYLSDALKQQEEDLKQQEELKEKIAEVKKAEAEKKEEAIVKSDKENEADELDKRAGKYGIKNLKGTNTLKKIVATSAIALVVGFGLGNIKNLFVNAYNNTKTSFSTLNENNKNQNQVHEIFTKEGIDAVNELTAAAMNVDGKYQTFTAEEWLTSYFEQNAGLFSDAEWAQKFNGYDNIIKDYDINHMSLNQKRINYFAFTKSQNAINPFLNLFEDEQDKKSVKEVWEAYYKAISYDATEADIENYNKKILEAFGLTTNSQGHVDESNNKYYGSREIVAAIASAGGINGISTQETMDLVYGNNGDIKGFYSTICSLNKSKRELILGLIKDRNDNTKLEVLASNIKTPRQLTEADYVKKYNDRVNENLSKLEGEYAFGGGFIEGSNTYRNEVSESSLTDKEKKEAQTGANDDFNDNYGEANRIAAAKGVGAAALNAFWSANSQALIMGTMPLSSLEAEASQLISGCNDTAAYVEQYTAGVNEAKVNILAAIASAIEQREKDKLANGNNLEAPANTENNVVSEEKVITTEETYDNSGNLVSTVTTDASIPGTQEYDATVYGLNIPDDYYESQSSSINR